MTDRHPDEPLDDLLHDNEIPRDPAFELDTVVEAARAAAVRDRRGHGWRVLLAVASLTVATVATIGALRPGWLPFDVPFRDSQPDTGGPTVRHDTSLRGEPDEGGPVLLRVESGTRLRVVGRSPDGRWVAAAAEGRPDIVGWVPANDLDGVDLGALATVTADPRATGSATAPAGPIDRPDLRIESTYAKENRLYVSVFNAGPADARGTLLASVDGGTPVPLEGKSDEGLRAGQRIQAAVRGVFVQIRGTVSVTVSLDPPVTEADQANNMLTGIVEPDQPTDLEIANVERGASALVVTVRNNSTIPITGAHTITLREPLPSNRLIERAEQTGTINAGGTLVISFPTLREADLTKISITLSSDSIADAVPGNNTYPR
ncbi:MAG: hypothetical protein C4558_01335 [Dehalococcoidia bacterium]|nr:MAG: hypothetical protein C4558_01335 [Dehalococcoidia bacterium]